MSYPTARLDSACKITMGQAPSGDSYNFENEGLALIAGAGDFGVLYPEPKKFTTKPGKISKKDEIILCIRATIGDLNWSNKEYCLGRGVAGLNAIPEKLEQKYLWNWLKCSAHILKEKGKGATFLQVSKEDIASLQIPLPPLEEQRRIAEILDKADELIQNRKKAIEKLDELLQATFIDMFGDPVTNPKGWEVKLLQDLSIKIHSGNTPKGGAENYVETGIIFLRSQNVWKNKVVLDDVAYIDEETHAKMSKSSVKHEDILMTKTGRINTENSSLGRAAIYQGSDDSANINGHVYLIRIKEGLSKYFILSILTQPDYYEYIRSICVGGIDKRQLNKEHLEKLPIIFPPQESQARFEKIMKTIGKQKQAMQAQLEVQETLFKSLQQQAFSGQL